MSFAQAAFLLFLVIDPVGGIPLFLTALRDIQERGRRRRVIFRECLIAALVLTAGLLLGGTLMDFLSISQTSLGIAGGLLLFIISLRMVFPPEKGLLAGYPAGEPFIVPLAVPILAGPSALATIVLVEGQAPDKTLLWLSALIFALGISTLILLIGERLTKVLGVRGLIACERLSGLVLVILAVDMFLDGLRDYVATF